MKKMIRILSISFLLTFFFISNEVSAQSVAPKAKFDANMNLSLDASSALSTSYDIDISGMTFKDETAAKRFFAAMTDNLMNWDLNYETKVATIHLHTQYQEAWTLSDWSKYLTEHAERFRLVYSRVNAN